MTWVKLESLYLADSLLLNKLQTAICNSIRTYQPVATSASTNLTNNSQLFNYLYYKELMNLYLCIFTYKAIPLQQNIKLFSLLTAYVFQNKEHCTLSDPVWHFTGLMANNLGKDTCKSQYPFFLNSGRQTGFYLSLEFYKLEDNQGEESWKICLTFSWVKIFCSFYSIFLNLQGI